MKESWVESFQNRRKQYKRKREYPRNYSGQDPLGIEHWLTFFFHWRQLSVPKTSSTAAIPPPPSPQSTTCFLSVSSRRKGDEEEEKDLGDAQENEQHPRDWSFLPASIPASIPSPSESAGREREEGRNCVNAYNSVLHTHTRIHTYNT